MRKVRFRTLGCYPLSGAVESEAATVEEIVAEMLLTKTPSGRAGRSTATPAARHGEEEAGGLFLMARPLESEPTS